MPTALILRHWGLWPGPQSWRQEGDRPGPCPSAANQTTVLSSARPLCLPPYPPSYLSSQPGPGVLSSLLVSLKESFRGRQEICGLHPPPAQAGPSRNRESKGPTRTPDDTVQRPCPPTSSDAWAASGEGRGPEGITERNPPLPGPRCRASHPW